MTCEILGCREPAKLVISYCDATCLAVCHDHRTLNVCWSLELHKAAVIECFPPSDWIYPSPQISLDTPAGGG